jgi:hypothetical protein
MWPSLLKIQYTELKLSCGNDPVVKNSIYSNGDLDLWPNDPKINRVLPLPQGNHVTNFGQDPIYRTKVIMRKRGSFPHDNFSSVFWIFTKLDHMIPLWKGKNPIYFGVIRSKVKVIITINKNVDNRIVSAW